MTLRTSELGWYDWWRTNRGVGIVFLVALLTLLAYLFTRDWAYIKLRDGIRLGFFPIAAVALMILTAVGLIFDRHHRETTSEMVNSDWRTWCYPVIATATLLAYFWTMTILGFVISTPILLAPVMYLLGARPLRAAIAASLITTVAVYVVFRVIGTSIHQGPLPF